MKRAMIHLIGRSVSWMLLAGVLVAIGCGQHGVKPSLEVTYIANEGFLISMGGTNVLVDALPQSTFYANPSDSLTARMIDGLSPFGTIDYFLVTHEHPDHFNAELASRFLLNHPTVQLLGNSETCLKLNGDGLSGRTITGIDLELGKQQTIHGDKAEIVVMRLHHGGNSGISNLAYLVRSNGYTIVHVGDARICDNEQYLRTLDWGPDGVDLLFMEYFDHGDDTREIIESMIKPKQVILMHIPPGDVDEVMHDEIQVHPRSAVFRTESETKTFGSEGGGVGD